MAAAKEVQAPGNFLRVEQEVSLFLCGTYQNKV